VSERDEPEWKTRQLRVDKRLEAAGWEIVRTQAIRPARFFAHHALEEFPTENGPADYALCAKGEALGIVEAKKVTLGPQNVLVQAQRYARGVADSPFNFRGFRVPFVYSTNGEVIWFQDLRAELSRSRRISGFHTPAALRELLDRDFDRASAELSARPNTHGWLRPYQIDANAAIENAIAARKRQMLVAMATGTGKTVTMVNQAYRLMKSGIGRRILFLVDRRALAVQAVRTFASFEVQPGLKFDKEFEVYSQRFRREDIGDDEKFDPSVLPAKYLLDPQPGHAFVYVCTIQRMAINLFGQNAVFAPGDETPDEDADRLDVPIHAFDVIIADECHRGYTTAELSVWRNTLDHFDAIKIGLTATPAAHTKAYFNDVVYRYEYDRAVREGYLVDYDPVKIRSNVRMSGVFLREGDQVGVLDTLTGIEHLEELEDEREYDSAAIEEQVTAPDSNRKIIEEVAKYALAHGEKYGRFPKTLIFAVNDLPQTSHADRLVEICRDVFSRGDAFVQKITGSPTVDRPLQRIREFRNRPEPAVVVSVDMMSTGVDIPDLEFIVFLRPVKSRILFEQMLGRGTRKGEKFPDKSHFTVFDCFDGTLLAYFKNASAFTAEPPDQPSRTIVQVIEDIWQNRDRAYNVRCLVKRLQRINKEMSANARQLFARFVDDGDLGKFAKTLPKQLDDDFSGTMKVLRDPDFQYLLVNYERPPRSFVIAYPVEDTVTSEPVIRDGLGNEYKPQDYLTAFSRFVSENQDQIDAIRILLNRPRNWSTQALTALRSTLVNARQRFTEDNLRRAHELKYGKALVDIISMVKHAANEQLPLLTAEERVDLALAQITAGMSLTQEQQRWLDRIRAHLVENLTIARDDFETMPVFAREGGWRPADRAFDGNLGELLDKLNEAVAA
jgi:type I restriction enzyme, R subunit